MGELETEHDALEMFAASTRSGRRNALPEIEIEIHDPDAAKLADRLSDLTSHCENQPPAHKDQPSTSKAQSTAP